MDTEIFTEGSIFYYNNRTNSKKDYSDPDKNHDFVVSRPVYIIKQPSLPFDNFTVNVCIITSSERRVGIPVSVDTYKQGKILPYSVYSLHKENLTRYMGQVSEEIKQEVRDALSYHLGFSDQKPNYLLKYEEDAKRQKEFVNELTVKERTVYDFLMEKCIFHYNYYGKFEETFQTYRHFMKEKNGYKRPCDFSKAMEKISKGFGTFSIHKENGVISYYGISINSRIRTIKNKSNTEINRGIFSGDPDDENQLEVSEMTKEQILKEMDGEQKKIYDRLDMLQKYQNYRKNPDNFDFKTTDHHNARLVKRLIEMDVGFIIQKIKKQLSDGKSPLCFSQVNQYIIYHFSDKEMIENVNKKYLKKGTFGLRKEIKNNIRYLFR